MYNISIYTFKIEVEGLDGKVWRTVELTNTSNVARLAYVIMVSFQTALYHLYNIEYKGKCYDSMICAEDDHSGKNLIAARKTGLYELNLKVEDELLMTYDYGAGWEFKIKLIDIKKMVKDEGYIVSYPKIIDGAGFGIIEDRHHSEVLDIINEIDRTGKITEYALTIDNNFKKWDYRKYDLIKDNKTLKARMYDAIVAYEELTDVK